MDSLLKLNSSRALEKQVWSRWSGGSGLHTQTISFDDFEQLCCHHYLIDTMMCVRHAHWSTCLLLLFDDDSPCPAFSEKNEVHPLVRDAAPRLILVGVGGGEEIERLEQGERGTALPTLMVA